MSIEMFHDVLRLLVCVPFGTLVFGLFGFICLFMYKEFKDCP